MTLSIGSSPFSHNPTTLPLSTSPIRPRKAEISYLIHTDEDSFKQPCSISSDNCSDRDDYLSSSETHPSNSGSDETYSNSDNYSSGNEIDSEDPKPSTPELKPPQIKRLSKIQLKHQLKEKIQKISNSHLVFKQEKIYKKDGFDQAWMRHYQELIEYKNKTGHCSVRKRENQSLGEWVSQQRRKFSKRNLLKNRFDLLIKIGFEFGDVGIVYKKRNLIESANKNLKFTNKSE